MLMLPVHPALVDDQCHEVPVSATIPQLPNHAVVDIRPGDQAAATEVDSWLQAYAASRDPELRERIILAYLGLTDRLAADELHQRLGRSPTTPEFAEHLELGEEEVLEGLAAAGSRLEVSLDQPAGDEGDRRLGDLVAAPGAREEPEDLLALPGLVAETAGAGTRGYRPAVLPGPGPVRDRGPGRLLPDARLSPAATRPSPDAHPADRTLTESGATAMQVLWMVLVTLGLALSGVLGLAVVSHVAARTRRR
jgi:hypothetical protein